MADTVKQSPRVAFGRTMEVEKPDPSLLFEWEKQNYYEQGNPDFDCEAAIRARQALKRYPKVSVALQKFWRLFKKDEKMRISKDDYIDVMVKIAKVLAPQFDEYQARCAAQNDWQRDSQGSDMLTYQQFFDSFFELADIWCLDIDGDEYANFLDTLQKRLTIKKITSPNGNVIKVAPTIKVVTNNEDDGGNGNGPQHKDPKNTKGGKKSKEKGKKKLSAKERLELKKKEMEERKKGKNKQEEQDEWQPDDDFEFPIKPDEPPPPKTEVPPLEPPKTETEQPPPQAPAEEQPPQPPAEEQPTDENNNNNSNNNNGEVPPIDIDENNKDKSANGSHRSNRDNNNNGSTSGRKSEKIQPGRKSENKEIKPTTIVIPKPLPKPKPKGKTPKNVISEKKLNESSEKPENVDVDLVDEIKDVPQEGGEGGENGVRGTEHLTEKNHKTPNSSPSHSKSRPKTGEKGGGENSSKGLKDMISTPSKLHNKRKSQPNTNPPKVDTNPNNNNKDNNNNNNGETDNKNTENLPNPEDEDNNNKNKKKGKYKEVVVFPEIEKEGDAVEYEIAPLDAIVPMGQMADQKEKEDEEKKTKKKEKKEKKEKKDKKEKDADDNNENKDGKEGRRKSKKRKSLIGGGAKGDNGKENYKGKGKGKGGDDEEISELSEEEPEDIPDGKRKSRNRGGDGGEKGGGDNGNGDGSKGRGKNREGGKGGESKNGDEEHSPSNRKNKSGGNNGEDGDNDNGNEYSDDNDNKNRNGSGKDGLNDDGEYGDNDNNELNRKGKGDGENEGDEDDGEKGDDEREDEDLDNNNNSNKNGENGDGGDNNDNGELELPITDHLHDGTSAKSTARSHKSKSARSANGGEDNNGGENGEDNEDEFNPDGTRKSKKGKNGEGEEGDEGNEGDENENGSSPIGRKSKKHGGKGDSDENDLINGDENDTANLGKIAGEGDEDDDLAGLSPEERERILREREEEKERKRKEKEAKEKEAREKEEREREEREREEREKAEEEERRKKLGTPDLEDELENTLDKTLDDIITDCKEHTGEFSNSTSGTTTPQRNSKIEDEENKNKRLNLEPDINETTTEESENEADSEAGRKSGKSRHSRHRGGNDTTTTSESESETSDNDDVSSLTSNNNSKYRPDTASSITSGSEYNSTTNPTSNMDSEAGNNNNNGKVDENLVKDLDQVSSIKSQIMVAKLHDQNKGIDDIVNRNKEDQFSPKQKSPHRITFDEDEEIIPGVNEDENGEGGEEEEEEGEYSEGEEGDELQSGENGGEDAANKNGGENGEGDEESKAKRARRNKYRTRRTKHKTQPDIDKLEPPVDDNVYERDDYDSEQEDIDLMHKKAPCYWVIGKPGVGKTTACEQLANKLNMIHIDIEKLVRGVIPKKETNGEEEEEEQQEEEEDEPEPEPEPEPEAEVEGEGEGEAKEGEDENAEGEGEGGEKEEGEKEEGDEDDEDKDSEDDEEAEAEEKEKESEKEEEEEEEEEEEKGEEEDDENKPKEEPVPEEPKEPPPPPTLEQIAHRDMLDGMAVPIELERQLIREAVEKAKTSYKGILIDGLPRNKEEFEAIKDVLPEPDYIINLDISDEDLILRRSGNRIDPTTGELFSEYDIRRGKPTKYTTNDDGDEVIDTEAQEEEDQAEKDAWEEILAAEEEARQAAEEEDDIPEEKAEGGEEEEEEPEDEEDEEANGGEEEVDLNKVVRRQHEMSGPYDPPLKRIPKLLIKRPEDEEENIKRELEEYKEQCLQPDETHLLIDATQTPSDVVEEILLRLGEQLPPYSRITNNLGPRHIELPDDLDGATSAEKQKWLLTDPEADPMNKVPRKWSSFRNLCPIALKEGRIEFGKEEYNVIFRGKLYLLSSEEAMKEFLNNPKPFLLERPVLPKCNKVWILGLPQTGKHTVAQKLAKEYQLAVYTPQQILTIMATRENSPVSEEIGPMLESGEVMNHKKAAQAIARFFNPTAPYKFGSENPPPPDKKKKHKKGEPEPEPEEEEEEQNVDEDDEDKPPKNPWDDIPDPDFLEDENVPKHYILIDYPNTVEQWEQLRNAHIFPKVVIILDPEGDDEAEEKMALRKHAAEEGYMYPDEDQKTLYSEAIQELEEAFVNDGVRVEHIKAVQSEEAVRLQTRQAIDPLKARTDPEDTWPEIPEAEEEDENPEEVIKRIQGDYLGYCPVTYCETGQLIPGNPEFQTFYNGKLYRFFGKEELEKFQNEPEKYLPKKEPEASSTRVLIIGPSGSGKSEIMQKLSEEFGIPVLDLSKVALPPRPPKQKKIITNEETGEEEEVEEEEDEEDAEEQDKIRLRQAKIEAIKKAIEESGGPLLIDGGIDSEDMLNEVINNKLHPTVVLPLQMTANDVSDRLFKSKFDWEPPKPKEKKPKKEKKKGNEDDEDDEDEEEEEEEDDFPTPEEIEEMRKEKEEECRNGIIEKAESEIEALEALTEMMKEKGIKVLKGVNAVGTKDRVYDRVKAALSPFLKEKVPFHRCVALKPDEAENLLNSDYYTLSKFGPYCPVTLKESDKIVMNPLFPVMYRHHIYFCDGAEARDKFIADPLKYLEQPPPPPNVVPRIAVIGPPLSGRTTLCHTLENDLGIIYADPSVAIEYILKNPSTVLHKKIKELIYSGESVPKELYVKALSIMLKAKKCRSQGWVIDGFPYTKEECDMLDKEGVVPNLIFKMNMERTTTMERMNKILNKNYENLLKKKYVPTLQSDLSVISHECKEYENNISEIETFHIYEYDNVRQLDGLESVWKIYDTAEELVQNNLRARRNYLKLVKEDKAARIYDLALPCNEIINHKGALSNYCPVRWSLDRELVCRDQDRQCICYFRGKYYYCSDDECMNKFLRQPTKYLLHQKLPSVLPRRIPMSEITTVHNNTISMKGYCPVTYSEGLGPRDWNSFVLGDPSLLVQYGNNIYSFANIQQLEKFMKCPDKYLTRPLPNKLPPKCSKTTVSELAKKNLSSMLGYVEQSFSELLIQAMTNLVQNRIKYPSCSVKESSIMYVALYMKAHNPKLPIHIQERQQERLMTFLKECGLYESILMEAPRGSALRATKALSKNFFDHTSLFDELLELRGEKLITKFLREKNSL